MDGGGGRITGRKTTLFLPSPSPPSPPFPGLTLTEAQHVVVVEPQLDPASELQAIGRVHRIGQERETWVHR